MRLVCRLIYLIFQVEIAAIFFIGAAPMVSACELNSAGNKIKYVINLQFSNLHQLRDNPNIPSDLEQMPYLHDFLFNNGTVASNHHTSLPANSAADVLTILTGVYGDRMGVPISNSYGFFRSDGSVGFASSFSYWTTIAADGLPQMLSETGHIAPAPWVPFTRAGCDVGVFAIPNMAIESVPSDVVTLFGKASAEANAAKTDPTKAKASFLGIAVHCARSSQFCADPAHARRDLLPDEPQLYDNFSALFGHAHVKPRISPNAPIRDLDGNVLQDAYGNAGFPNLFSPTASQTLGYAATMAEAGVPIIYAFIGDMHDQSPSADGKHALGPGEAALSRQLKAADIAFQRFLERLAAKGITKDNTLFIIASDEGGHFVGGAPTPSNCNGSSVPCSYTNDGEINVFIDRLLSTQRHNVTAFDINFNTAPSFYVYGSPSPTDPTVRILQQDVGKLTAVNPVTGQTQSLTLALADRGTMKLLHMVTASPARTPSFTLFGHPDYFQMTSGTRTDCTQQPACVEKDSAYLWGHGGVDSDMSRTWFGLVGPGVLKSGLNSSVFSDHADIRPTVLALLGLTDDYTHDGRTLVEILKPEALPPAIGANVVAFSNLAAVYKQLNAPLGQFGKGRLAFASRAILDSDSAYAKFLALTTESTAARDALAGEIKSTLEAAAFENKPIDAARATYLAAQATLQINKSADSLRVAVP